MPEYEPCVAHDSPEFALFCEHLSARICALDFVYKTRELGTEGYDPHAPATLIFPIKHPIAVDPLFKSDYADLLKAACSRMTITAHSTDSFRSELDDELMEFYRVAIADQASKVAVAADASRPAFVVTMPDLLSDLVLSPLSQLHSAVVENCRHFMELIQALDNDPKRLFLNARTSSVFSMFVLTWVANRLGVPLVTGDPNSSVAVV